MVILLEQAIRAHVAPADGISVKYYRLKVDITKKTSRQRVLFIFKTKWLAKVFDDAQCYSRG